MRRAGLPTKIPFVLFDVTPCGVAPLKLSVSAFAKISNSAVQRFLRAYVLRRALNK
jgi:hypothetical protein